MSKHPLNTVFSNLESNRFVKLMKALVVVVILSLLAVSLSAAPSQGAPSKAITISKVGSAVSKARNVTVKLKCVSSRTCKGSVRIALGSKKSAARSFSIKPKKTKTLNVKLTAAQVKLISATQKGQRTAKVVVTVKKPNKATVSKKATLKVAKKSTVTPSPAPQPSSTPVVTPEPSAVPTDDHDHSDHGETDSLYSAAYLNTWKPTSYDTCTQEEHNSFAVTGPDGKLYPGWHPPTMTRADGTVCTFGHEHGDDPSNSDIFDWAVSFMQQETPAVNGIPFGYGSERLTVYSNHTGSSVHRHEDDTGHKIVVSNNQKMGVKYQDRWGDSHDLVCDFLMKMHQGSWSSDATKNNTHELFYATKCNDGTEIITTVMTNYGNANQLHPSCTRDFLVGQSAPSGLPTVGSILPVGDGGMRLIPTADCIEQYVKGGVESGNSTNDLRGSPASTQNAWWWAGYEQWRSYTSIKDTGGNEIIRFEPWFGIQNPSRYYVSNGPTDTNIAYLNDLSWEVGNQQSWQPWAQQRAQNATLIDRRSPEAWFNGAIRDAWITNTVVKNSASSLTSATVYHDPWGKNAANSSFVGSIRSHISRTDNTKYVTTSTPSTASRNTRVNEALKREGASVPQTMGFFYNYGESSTGASLGVHAPN